LPNQWQTLRESINNIYFSIEGMGVQQENSHSTMRKKEQIRSQATDKIEKKKLNDNP